MPVPLSPEDHIELLPAIWRAVNAYSIKISHRTYDAAELNPIRHQKSGVTARKGLWEVHYDPYDVSKVFVRGPGGWISCPWKYLKKVPVPFGELAWDHVAGQLARQGRAGAGELEHAQAVDDLLRRAYHGPPGEPAAAAADTARSRRRLSARDRRVAARTRATMASRAASSGGPPADGTASHAVPAGGRDVSQAPGQDDDEPAAKVIPLGIFDPFEEAKKGW